MMKAFSLIELLVVLAIVSILGALSIPALGSYRAAQLTRAGNDVADLIAAARQDAVTRNRITAVLLVTSASDPTLNNRAVAIYELGPDPTWTQARKCLLLPAPIQITDSAPDTDPLPGAALTVNPVNGATVNATSALVFYPDVRIRSSLTGTRTWTLALPSSPHTYAIEFTPETAFCHVVRN